MPTNGYSLGERSAQTRRLIEVASYSDGELIRSYEPQYALNTDYIDSQQVCNANSCLATTSFDWSKGSDVINSNGEYNALFDPIYDFENLIPDNRFKGLRHADVNGDGKLDVLGIRNKRNAPNDHFYL